MRHHPISVAQLQPFLNLDFYYCHPSKDLFPTEKLDDKLCSRKVTEREELLFLFSNILQNG